MIAKEDGMKILKYIQSKNAKPVQIIDKFEMNAKNDNPMYEIWLTNSDESGLKFVEFFEGFH